MSETGKKPTKAVALLYDPVRGDAPRVVAGGGGEIALRIIECARENSVPVVEDPDLLQVLGSIPVGEEIPPELYRAIAEILSFVYRLNGRFPSE